MRVLELPDMLRKYGVEPVLVAGHETRGNEFPARPLGALRHWTAGPTTGRTPSLGVVTNGRGGSKPLPGPLCTVLQSRETSGLDKAYVVALGKANHAGEGSWNCISGNYRLLGLEIEWSGPNETFSAARRDVSERIMAALLDCCANASSNSAAEHREYATPAGRKIDTNLDGNVLRRRMFELRLSVPPPSPSPTPTPPEDDDMIRIVNLTDPENPGKGVHTYAVSGVVGRHMKRPEDITELLTRFGAVDERPKGTTSAWMFDLVNGPLKTPLTT